MLIEYKIKFEKDGLTIAQHIEPNSSPVTNSRSKAPITGLPASQAEMGTLVSRNPLTTSGGGPGDKPGGGPGDKPGGNAGGFGNAPIFILGPIVFGNSVPETKEIAKPQEPAPASAPKARGTAAGG